MAEQIVTLSPGESKLVSFEAVPHEPKTYQVSVDGLTGSFKAVSAVPKFYMPPEFTKAKITERWEMWPYYYAMEFECPITNKGTAEGTHTILVGNNHPSDLEPWSFELALKPGESYIWKRFQHAIWPMTFYLTGDWEENNHSKGAASW